jgi:hypothetical protein
VGSSLTRNVATRQGRHRRTRDRGPCPRSATWLVMPPGATSSWLSQRRKVALGPVEQLGAQDGGLHARAARARPAVGSYRRSTVEEPITASGRWPREEVDQREGEQRRWSERAQTKRVHQDKPTQLFAVCDGESRADGAAEQVADKVGRRRASPQRAPFLGILPGFAIFVTAIVADAVKPTSAEAIAQLRALGLQPRQGAQGRHSPGQRARGAGHKLITVGGRCPTSRWPRGTSRLMRGMALDRRSAKEKMTTMLVLMTAGLVQKAV